MSAVRDVAAVLRGLADELEWLSDEAQSAFWQEKLRKMEGKLHDAAWSLDERPCRRCNVFGEIGLRQRLGGSGIDLDRIDRRTLAILTRCEQDGPSVFGMTPQEYDRWKSGLPECPACTTHTGEVGFVYPNMEPTTVEVNA